MSAERLGPYVLLRRLSRGGRAEVWEARDERDGTAAAVKRLLPRYRADADAMGAMDEELDVHRWLEGVPGVVPVLDGGQDAGERWLAFSLVSGVDAARACDANRGGAPMSAALALGVIAQLARTLAGVHAACEPNGRPLRIVHRDVSPHNVLLSADGRVWLTDFGLALHARRTRRTTTGIVKGKSGYLAPEQAMERPVMPAADVYGAGATLCTLVRGRPPLEGWSGLVARCEGARLDLSGVASELRPVLEACLAVAPDERPTAAALQAEARAARLRLGGSGPVEADLAAWLGERTATPPAEALDDLFDWPPR